MKTKNMRRRDFIKHASVFLALGISGCSFQSRRPVLKLVKNTLPKDLLNTLSKYWSFKYIQNQSSNKHYQLSLKDADLISIGDGWLSEVPIEEIQVINSLVNFPYINSNAIQFLEQLHPSITNKVFPIGYSPWVMIFRNPGNLLLKARQSWNVLFEEELRGEIVFPRSPRLIMSILDNIDGISDLKTLKTQARTFDDRNALNWVISGKAKVAILPLQSCYSSLIRDPRLKLAIPQEGSPLNWNLLIRPKNTQEPFPSNWINEAFQRETVAKLLAKGFIPPIEYSQLLMAKNSFISQKKSLFLPSKSFLENCWSLSMLEPTQKNLLKERWNE